MALDDTNQPTMERHINWGGVIKGVAIVTAVVAAGVVGFWLLSTIVAPAITGAITASPALSALAAGAHTGAVAVAHGAGWVVGSVGHLLGGIPAGLAHILGLTGQQFAQSAALNHVVGIGGAAVAGTVAAHAAIPYLQHGHYIDVDTTPRTEPGVMAATVPMHDLSHMAHHAASHADEQHANAQWTNRIPPRVTSYTTFADSARASKEERKAVAPSPSDSFVTDLNDQRQQLDAVLSK